MRKNLLLLLSLFFAITAWGQTKYWDLSTASGLQPGNGNWDESTPLWSTGNSGSNPLGLWSNTWSAGKWQADAYFQAPGISVITVVGANSTAGPTWQHHPALIGANKIYIGNNQATANVILQIGEGKKLISGESAPVNGWAGEQALLRLNSNNASAPAVAEWRGHLQMGGNRSAALKMSGYSQMTVAGNNLFIGHNEGRAVMNIGGYSSFSATTSNPMYVGNLFNGIGIVNLYDDATMTLNGAMQLGQINSPVFSYNHGILTIAGNANFTSNGLLVGGGAQANNAVGEQFGQFYQTGGIATINGSVSFGGNVGAAGTTIKGNVILAGGSLAVSDMIQLGTAASTGTIIEPNLIFRGGTLTYTGSVSQNNWIDLGANGKVIVYEGATIDVGGQDVTISMPLLKATGYGVASISLANAGTHNYVPPGLRITGGLGSGATGITQVDEQGLITGFIVTSPGVGYAPSDVLTTHLDKVTGGGAAGTVTLVDNATYNGGLTKNGTGTLTLTGNNTYSGNTVVNEGILSITNPYLNDMSTVTIATGAKMDLDFVGTDDITSLTLGGNSMIAGTYNATSHPNFFTGTGSLNVTASPPVSNLTQQIGYLTIQPAINAASNGDVIEVAAGTYDGFRVTGKTNLTVQASGVVTITPVNISGETAGVYVDPGTTGLIIDGFSFDGTGLTNSRGVIGRDGSGYEVKNSSFANLATGVYANGTGSGNVSLTVKNSTFTNCSAGVGGTEATNPAIITGNTFTIPTNGEGVGLGTGVGGLTLNDNSFTPSTEVAIANYTTSTLSATCNWFGQASGPAAGQISGNVTTIPFLTDGNDSDGSTPGFQPAAGSCVGGPVKVYADATTTTVQSAHATIQDAIDAATTINSNVIRVDAGTYNETLNISKSVAVISAATPTTDAIIRGGGGTGAADAVVRFSANDATLEGFTIDRNDATGNNRAIAPMASSGTTIKDNTIINAFRGIQGDFYGSPTNLTISGNTFSGSVSYGISGTENMNGLTITGNTFTDNTEGIGLGTGLTNLSITGNNSFTSTDPTTKHIAAYGSNLMPDISALYTNNTFGAAFSVNPTNGTDGTTAAIYNSLATSLANTSTDVTTQSTLQIPDNTSISGDLDLSGTPGNDPAVNLSPGNSPGCVTVAGNLSTTSNDTYEIEVDGITACTEHDQFTITGNLTLGNATLNLVLGYDPAHNASFTILKNDGLNAVNGTFSGLTEGALFTANYNGAAYTLSISYTGGDGNDVVVTALTRVRVYNATNALVSTHNDIQPAIIAPTTMDGYSITLEAGTYYGNVFSSGEVIISKEVAIKGANTGTSGNAARVAESELVGFFQVLRNNVTIDGLKISSLGTALVNDNSNAYQAYLNGATSYFNNISFINNIVTGKDGSSAVVQLDKASNPNQATLASSDWNVSDNRFESFEGTTGNTVISVKGISGVTINNNVIQYNATDATTSTNALDGRKGIDVDFVEQTGKTIQITGNTIALNADVSDPATRDAELAKAPFGIRVLGDIKDITLSSNTISKTQDGIIVEKNGSGSNQISNGTLNSNAITDINNGISVTAGSLLNVSGTSNSVEAFKSAIVLDVDAGTFTNVQLIENKLVSGATFYGLQAITSSTTTDQILSRCNWYGAADFATVTAKNDGPIDFTQFATDGDLANLKCGKVLDEISAFLEGPFDITTGSMKTLLNTPQAPVIPIFPSQPSVLETHGLTQPYSAAPFSYAGTETTTAQFLTDNDSIVDWVLIETRDVTDRTVVLERKAAFICAKGRIISHDGNPIVMETGGSPTFHIALWHRNHTNIATKDPVPGKWDIRESSANVYEQTISVGPITQTLKTLKTQGFYKVIYGGDGNNDNSITSTDFNAWIQAAGQNGYFIGDFDLNGNVTTSDLNLPVGNIGQDISFPQ